MLLLGEPGSGKTEVLARRFVRLAEAGAHPEEALLLASTRATAERLRQRVEALLDVPYEELWIGTWESIGERLLRDHAEAAGLDPFFDVVGRAERLAMLLDRIDELPLRQHEIRGNPAGLLARLLERIDETKGSAQPPDPELAELVAAHDRILAAACSLDSSDVFLTLDRVLSDRSELREAIAGRFPELMVDELEETTRAQRAILATLAAEPGGRAYATEEESTVAWFEATHPDGETVALEDQFRRPALRFWRCANERAQAQAVAREVEHLLADRGPAGSDLRADRRPGGARRPGRRGDGGARHPASTSRGRRRSSSGPRCATRSPGCACSPTPPTPPPRRGR